MFLPPELSKAIQQKIESVNRAELAKAAAELTQHYKREEFASTAIRTPAHRAAYLAVRFPATFAANLRVFSEIRRSASGAAITSILDIGAGPGTALYAAVQIFPLVNQATLIDADGHMIEMGKRLSANSSHTTIRAANWTQQDIRECLSNEPHDLVVISYSSGELSPAEAERLFLQAWHCTKRFLAIVEPGTTQGFGFVLKARTLLIGAGGHVVAPCPHAKQCPMAVAGDWCHFSARVERTALHRHIKHGALGYEDEKFSYVVFSRSLWPQAETRILRHPQKHSGHVQFVLCGPNGLERTTIARSDKERYKLARKAEWGDPWDESPRDPQ